MFIIEDHTPVRPYQLRYTGTYTVYPNMRSKGFFDAYQEALGTHSVNEAYEKQEAETCSYMHKHNLGFCLCFLVE